MGAHIFLQLILRAADGIWLLVLFVVPFKLTKWTQHVLLQNYPSLNYHVWACLGRLELGAGFCDDGGYEA